MRRILLAALLALAGCSSGHPAVRTPSRTETPRTETPRATEAPPTTETRPGTPSRTTARTTPTPSASTRPGAAAGLPRFAHVVVVVEENHAYGDVVGNSDAPYLNSLAASGASFTQSYAITHPSEPNYLALFSGSTHGLTDDSCPHTFSGANIASELLAEGRTFAGYSDDLPSPGYTGCSADAYARKHNPWVNFPNVPASANQPFTAFPSDYSQLPDVAFVIPNLDHDMHDGTIAEADSWLRDHLSGYAKWATTHDSLLIVTWDEDDNSSDNRIPTIFAGAHVRTGQYGERIDHYRVLRTIEDLFGLPHAGASGSASPLSDVWAP